MNVVIDDLRYTRTHEWVRLEDDIATVGISEHAQELLGELVFVELPAVDEKIFAGDEIGVLESVKAASDFYAPLSGVIVEVNKNLFDSPNLVNNYPCDDGWIVKIKVNNQDEYNDLLTAELYQTNTSEGE